MKRTNTQARRNYRRAASSTQPSKIADEISASEGTSFSNRYLADQPQPDLVKFAWAYFHHPAAAVAFRAWLESVPRECLVNLAHHLFRVPPPSHDTKPAGEIEAEDRKFFAGLEELDHAAGQAHALMRLIVDTCDSQNTHTGHWTEEFGGKMWAGIDQLVSVTAKRLDQGVESVRQTGWKGGAR